MHKRMKHFNRTGTYILYTRVWIFINRTGTCIYTQMCETFNRTGTCILYTSVWVFFNHSPGTIYFKVYKYFKILRALVFYEQFFESFFFVFFNRTVSYILYTSVWNVLNRIGTCILCTPYEHILNRTGTCIFYMFISIFLNPRFRERWLCIKEQFDIFQIIYSLAWIFCRGTRINSPGYFITWKFPKNKFIYVLWVNKKKKKKYMFFFF